jgi:hypothetical protein
MKAVTIYMPRDMVRHGHQISDAVGIPFSRLCRDGMEIVLDQRERQFRQTLGAGPECASEKYDPRRAVAAPKR